MVALWTTLVGIMIGVLSTLGLLIITDMTPNDVMEEAFDRGFATQCVGKTGYYWECDE